MKVINFQKPIAFIFILPLFLLLLNDHYLKYTFPNFFTGKLSDVAGLIVWYVLFISIFPKHSKAIIIITALLFLFWKSPYSQISIDLFNHFCSIKLHRTIDYSDLWALLILVPLHNLKTQINHSFFQIKKGYKKIYFTISIFAICATSAPDYLLILNYEYSNTTWTLPISKRAVIEKTRLPRNEKKEIDLILRARLYTVFVEDFSKKGINSYNIQIIIDSLDEKHCKLSLVKLFDFDSGYRIKKFSKERFVSIFQTGFINPVSTKDSTNILARYSF